MSFSHFILQGLNETDDHLTGLSKVFSLSPLERGLVATAFMNRAGADFLAGAIDRHKNAIEVYVGIRNGITSKQALETLMNNGIYPYVVDTASQAYIFHPKVYIASNDIDARMMVGSANVTSGGMARNVEASLYSELSMDSDGELVCSVYSQFDALRENYPENVFRISLNDLDRMAAEGLLTDETHASWTASAKAHGSGRADTRRRMRLKTRNMPKLPKPERIIHRTAEGTAPTAFINHSLLWKSGRLTRRDLNIPTGTNTNPTGSMLLKKGDASQDIDQRFYFRQQVFVKEAWENDPDPRYSHLERCTCQFRFVIKGIDYGVFSLRLSHNTRTDTATFAQKNSMTQIHWGEARPLIAREDLLDSICRLYAPDENGVYTLVFDDE